MNIFNGLFDTSTTTVISAGNFLLCIGISLVLGIIIALSAKVKNEYTNSFLITLAVLPAIVCVVIMMVNGNIGAGVAIAGAFALIRFRSAPGDAKQIALVFMAMASGLMAGMGYLAYAALFVIIMCIILICYTCFIEGKTKLLQENKMLKITIPEDLDYTNVFDDILKRYTSSSELIKVSTSNMGSLYKLTYKIKMKEAKKEKNMIDELRCRNGNLEISVFKSEKEKEEL